MTERLVLSVDDNFDDELLLKHACKKAAVTFRLDTAGDGAKAIAYFQRCLADQANEPRPDFVLLDLNMPIKTGFEVLEWLRAEPGGSAFKVAVFTSSANRDDVANAYARGADYYLAKPADIVALFSLVTCIDHALRDNIHHPWPCVLESSAYKPAKGGQLR
jgi:CheY-like chemotaxis protein